MDPGIQLWGSWASGPDHACRAEAGGLLSVQGQPVLAGQEHKAFPSPRAARPPASPWRQGGDTEPLPPGGHGGIQWPGGRGGSDIHSQSSPSLIHSLTVSPLLRKSNTLILLPQKITHSHPTALENHSQSSPCLRKSLTDIPLHQ